VKTILNLFAFMAFVSTGCIEPVSQTYIVQGELSQIGDACILRKVRSTAFVKRTFSSHKGVLRVNCPRDHFLDGFSVQGECVLTYNVFEGNTMTCQWSPL
jgi:hypothetical protein